MLSPHLRERLKDADYRDLHLKAVGVLREVSKPNWYDAHFLMIFEAAKRFIDLVRPDRLDAFLEGFDVLLTPKDFGVREVSNVFPFETQKLIEETVASIASDHLKDHEITDFGRHVVHDHPYFTELQNSLTPRVSEWARCDLEPGYNFLSLYGSSGKCDLHMDHPLSMFTLDYCIDQNVQWPIHFSKVVDWPNLDIMQNWEPEGILNDPNMGFSGHVLEPGKAILFSGSSQWHYRDPIPSGGYCNLLFFHFFPKGAGDLVYFAEWPSRFDIPELGPLCDLFADTYPQLARKV